MLIPHDPAQGLSAADGATSSATEEGTGKTERRPGPLKKMRSVDELQQAAQQGELHRAFEQEVGALKTELREADERAASLHALAPQLEELVGAATAKLEAAAEALRAAEAAHRQATLEAERARADRDETPTLLPAVGARSDHPAETTIERDG